MKIPFIKTISLSGIFFLTAISFRLSAQNDSAADNRVYIIVSQMPTFQGDLDAYMGNNLHYPQSAIDKGIQGTVNITFVVTKSGEVTKVSVLSGVSPDIDSEAVRVVRNMPPWNPGIKNGKAVNVQYNLPVYFQLNTNQSQQQNRPPGQQQNIYARDSVFIPRDGLYIDPYIGYGVGGPNSSTSTPITMGGNLKVGAGLSYIYPSGIGISAGLQVQQYSFNYSYSQIISSSSYNGVETAYRIGGGDTEVTAGYAEKATYSFTYIQLPLLCRYISSQENRVGLYAEAGIVINYLVNSSISGNVTQTQYILTQAANTNWYTYALTDGNINTDIIAAPQNAAKLTFALHAAAGVILPLSDRISLIFAASPDFALMNAGDGSKDVLNFSGSQFYLYGKGSYGSFNSYTFDVKVLVKIFGSSESVRRY